MAIFIAVEYGQTSLCFMEHRNMSVCLSCLTILVVHIIYECLISLDAGEKV